MEQYPESSHSLGLSSYMYQKCKRVVKGMLTVKLTEMSLRNSCDLILLCMGTLEASFTILGIPDHL